MNTKEILDKGVNHTFVNYLSKLNKNSTLNDNYNVSLIYSAMILVNIINGKSKAFNAYSKDVELKEEMETLSKIDIKKELLKNLISNAILVKLNVIKLSDLEETRIRSSMDADNFSVSVYNNILMYGVKKGFKMLNNRSVLYNACELYVRNRINNRAAFFDEVLNLNADGVVISDMIDEYFDNKTKTLIKK